MSAVLAAIDATDARAWELKPLAEVAEILDGKRIPVNAKEREKRPGRVPYYGATGQVGWIDDFLFDEELVLLGEDGAPFLEPSKSKAYVIRGKSWVNNHAHVLRARAVPTGWLAHYLNVVRYDGLVTGTTRLKLTQAAMRQIRVPVAPWHVMEQRVAEIEKQFSRLDEAVANLKRVKAGLGRYRAAVLAQLTSGTGGSLFVDGEVALSVDGEVHDLGVYLPKLPSHWRWTTVGSVGSVKGGKRLPAGHTYAAERTPYPYVRVTDFLDFGIDTSGLQFLSEPTHREIERYTISASDVYISIAGSIGLVGQIPAHLNNANLTENAAKITFLKDIEAKYLVYWLASPIGRQLIAKSTIATTQSKLALFRIEKLPVPLPPLDEQRRIVVEVDRRLSIVREVDVEVDSNLKRAHVLRQAILTCQFSLL